MRCINRVIQIVSIVILAGCAPATSTVPTAIPGSPTSPAQPTAASPAQPTVASPTAEPARTLDAGQSTFAFYQEAREQVLLVNGGPEQGKPATDPLELWAWDGTSWSLISADPNGPTWRNWAAIAYDTDRDVLVIHGGLQDSSHRFDETWEWDGTGWERFAGQGPGPREGSLLVYDPERQKSVLFGGAENLDIKGDTWEWDGSTWRQVSETGPAPRFPGGMVYDPIRRQVLMYSGHFASPTGDFIDYGDLWGWDGTSWQEIPLQGETPGHRTHDAMVFDPQTERILLFSGGMQSFRSDIWAWDGQRWTEIPAPDTPARSGHSVAYDAKRDRFVFFGGIEQPARPALDDTWEWDRTTWTCLSNCQ